MALDFSCCHVRCSAVTNDTRLTFEWAANSIPGCVPRRGTRGRVGNRAQIRRNGTFVSSRLGVPFVVMQDEWQRSDAEFESIHSNAIVGRSAWGFL